jgi:hypothetical protein
MILIFSDTRRQNGIAKNIFLKRLESKAQEFFLRIDKEKNKIETGK